MSMIVDDNGAVPLPTGPLRVQYDPSAGPMGDDDTMLQQPQTDQIAVFEAMPNDDCPNGSTLDVNSHFVVYAVKNGLIRVLHRHSTLRSLLRGHEHEVVTDISFFQSGDVLGTVGGHVLIWRIFERSTEIVAEKLLEIPNTLRNVKRLVWHPFNPNQFWLIHDTQDPPAMGIAVKTTKTVATLVETTRISTGAHPTERHAVCTLYNASAVMEGALQLSPGGATTTSATATTTTDPNTNASNGNSSSASSSSRNQCNITDLCWSGRDPRHVITAQDDGTVRLWDVKTVDHSVPSWNGTLAASCIAKIQVQSDGSPINRCLFVPYDSVARSDGSTLGEHLATSGLTTAFVTGTKGNSCITLWSPFTNADTTESSSTATSLPTQHQVFCIGDSTPSSYNLNICYGPISQYNQGGDSTMSASATTTNEPPAFFFLLSDRTKGKLFAIHLKAIWSSPNIDTSDPPRPLALGVDYVVPFSVKYPTYSWSIMCAPAEHFDESAAPATKSSVEGALGGVGASAATGRVNFDIRFFALQSKMVQQMTLRHYMCSPPSKAWIEGVTPGVSAEPLQTVTNMESTMALPPPPPPPGLETMVPSSQDFEEYDVDGEDNNLGQDHEDDDNGILPDDEGNQQFDDGPDPSAVPPPTGFDGSSSSIGGGGNVFANWLGALAGKKSASSPPPLPPPPPTQLSMGAPEQSPAPSISKAPPLMSSHAEPLVSSDHLHRSILLDRDASKSPNLPPAPPSTPATGVTTTIPLGLMEAATLPKITESNPTESVMTTASTTAPPKLLSPMEFLTQQKPDPSIESSTIEKADDHSKKPKSQQSPPREHQHQAKNKNRKKSPNRGANANNKSHKKVNPPTTTPFPSGDTKISILKRETPTTSAAASVDITTPPAPSSSNVLPIPPPPTTAVVPVDWDDTMKKFVSAQLKAHEKTVLHELQKMVRSEVQNAFLSSDLQKSMSNAVEQALKPLEVSMKKQSEVNTETAVAAISGSVREPLQEAFTESMKSLFIPAFESATREIYSQIESNAPSEDQSSKIDVQMVSNDLGRMTQAIEVLTAEVTQLRAMVERQAAAATNLGTSLGFSAGAGGAIQPPSPPVPPQLDPMEVLRNDILVLLQARKYEQAFTEALRVTTPDMAVFCCRHADLTDVLGGSTPALSQPILLCLMQQIATVLVAPPSSSALSSQPDLKTELEWLQEIAIVLNPSASGISNHVPGVLQMLENNINIKMAQGDPSLRRPLQMLLQVIRGMKR